ncbi:unnamed protein product [Discosporangium mesarthrocarpum]
MKMVLIIGQTESGGWPALVLCGMSGEILQVVAAITGFKNVRAPGWVFLSEIHHRSQFGVTRIAYPGTLGEHEIPAKVFRRLLLFQPFAWSLVGELVESWGPII